MSYRKSIYTTVLAGLLLSLSPHLAAAEDAVWQGFRGLAPDADLPETFGLTTVWQRELGAGYSSIAVSGNQLITLFTSGEDDVLAAFDKTTGDELWRLKLADKYAGHDGSDDGPLASPTVDGDRVYALGAKGQLVAASLKDGSELWRVQLDESNSTVPFYGYTATPLVVDDLVIVLAGGPGRTVAAYHRADGKLVWQTGDDSITYQSPIVAELGGKRQIVAVSDFEVRGLNPSDGVQLWSYRHTEEAARAQGSVHPTAIDGGRVLINLSDGAQMLKVQADGTGWTVEELWRGRPFGNALVLPVLHDGALYGFTGRILTAVDPDTGDFHWRTRDAQGVNLSLVGSHLATVTFDGHLSVAQASPDAFIEVARAKVFDRGDYADPAFSDGVFYVRNQSHLAALRVDSNADSGVTAPEQDAHQYLGDFGAWVKGVEGKAEGQRQAAVDAYFADVEHTPIVEADGSAHIIYRGDAEEVVVQGTVFGWTGEEAVMHRVAGTNLHYRSLKLDPKGNYSYQLAIGFDRAGPDAANPLEEDAGFTRRSELRGAEFRANPHIVEPAEGVQKGTLDSFRFYSEILENSREINVWIPADYSAENTYPLLVVNHGLDAIRNGGMGNTLDHVVGNSVEPLVAVFVPRLQGSEYNGDSAADFARFLVEELVPHVQRHYRTGDRRAIMGPASASIISLRTAMEHPGVFQQVALQSLYLQDAYRDDYLKMLDDSTSKPRVRMETGPNDYVIPSAGIEALKANEQVSERLKAKGLDVDMHTVHGIAGWVGWRAQFDLILEDLFPSKSSDEQDAAEGP